LLGRHSTTAATLPPFLLWVFWRQCITFCPGWPGPQSYLCFLLRLGWQACATLLSFFCWIRISRTFCLDWPGTGILPISASHVAGMRDGHHCARVLAEMGSHEHFAQASLESRFSQSHPPK
jgi:hypothetical protein